MIQFMNGSVCGLISSKSAADPGFPIPSRFSQVSEVGNLELLIEPPHRLMGIIWDGIPIGGSCLGKRAHPGVIQSATG